MTTRARPPKQRRPLRALLLLGCAGFGAIAVVVVVAALYFLSRTDTVQALRHGIDAAAAAESAPGTDALRALGCARAYAADYDVVLRDLKALAPPNSPTVAAYRDLVQIVCTGAPPTATCERVAQAYRAATASRSKLYVSVSDAASPERAADYRCRIVLSATDERLPDEEERLRREEEAAVR